MLGISLYLSLLIATLTQSILLIAMLVSNKKNGKAANYLLSTIIALFTYYVLIKFFHRTELIGKYPYFLQTYKPIPFIVWPALYFYIKIMTNPSFKFRLKDIIHLLPFIIYLSVLFPFFISNRSIKIQTISSPVQFHYILALIFQTILLIIYTLLSYRVLYKYQQQIKNIFSDIEKLKLNWLKNLIIVFVTIWVIAIVRFFSGIEYRGHFILSPVLLSITIYAIGFYALKQPDIFRDISIGVNNADKTFDEFSEIFIRESPVIESSKINKPKKYKYSTLTDEELAVNKDKLLNFLKKEKPYLNNDLKLQDLADATGFPIYHISQIISTQLNRNFYDLINSYRIEEAKQLLCNPQKQNLTILAIAFEAGFNSKSVFNTAFKKHTNTTPSRYRLLQLKAISS